MSIINIQRDGSFANPSNLDARVPWVVQATNLGVPLSSNQIISFYDYGFVASDTEAPATISPNEYGNIGLFIEPPRRDRVPYRIQASCSALGALMIGYGPAAITTESHSIQNVQYIPFGIKFDGILTIEPAVGTYEGRPLYIGVATGEQQTAAYMPGYLSVQNLGVKPPTMQNAIS